MKRLNQQNFKFPCFFTKKNLSVTLGKEHSWWF